MDSNGSLDEVPVIPGWSDADLCELGGDGGETERFTGVGAGGGE
jgi:hypothetical protein